MIVRKFGAASAILVLAGLVCRSILLAAPMPEGAQTPASQAAATWTFCSSEGGTCAFSGTRNVRYGSGSTYVFKTVTGGTACTNAVFGDPTYGVPKHCDYDTATTTATLSSVTISGPTALDVGQSAAYAAMGRYSDGTSKDVTSSAAWSISAKAKASITSAGQLTALAAGSVNVKASFGGLAAPKLALKISAASSTPGSGETVYVSPSGSDSNAGTKASPVRTIQKAVTLANLLNYDNDVVIDIANGVYREAVQIHALATTKTLTLLGHGATTVLTGADDWSTGWTLQADGSYVHAWPYKWGTKPVPNGWEDYWNWDGLGYKRDALLRSEMVYVNGKPLKTVLKKTEISGAGTFYVDESGAKLYMRLPAGAAFTGSLIEVGIRTQPLLISGRNNIVLKNLAIMRSRGAIQEDAVHVANLQNFTLDGVTIQWTAYAGMGITKVKGVRIRNSLLSDNGVHTIVGLELDDVIFEDNEVSRNNWRGWAAEHKGYDTVGKWIESRDVIVRRSSFVDNWGHGVWFDGDNQRITIDSVFSARNALRGVSLEYNAGPVVIENSKFCENGLVGISNARSNNTTTRNNQIFDNGYYQIMATGSPTPITVTDSRTGAKYQATGENWTITNNVIRGKALAGGDPADNSCYPGPCGWVFWTTTELNDIYDRMIKTLTSDYNEWYNSSTTKSFRVPDPKGQAVDLAAFRALMSTVKPNDTHSVWGKTTKLSCTP